MGAKFIIDRRCQVKTTLTLTGLIEGLKFQSILRSLEEMAAAEMPGNVTVQELRHQNSVLQEHQAICSECRSSMRRQVGGCIGYVPYPISAGMEYLLWITALRALDGDLPSGLLPGAQAFARSAQLIHQTPFSNEMRARGDLVSPKPRARKGWLFSGRGNLSSAQVMDSFFVNGVLSGEPLQTHECFLAACLAVARAMDPAMPDPERRRALREDVQPYVTVHNLMERALEQGLGVYVWP